MLVQVPRGVVHVVERLAPGGIETFVLDMLRSGSPADRVFSLQGTLPHLLSRWPTLYEFSDRVEAFGKNPGLQIGLIPRIAARLRALQPEAVIVHHIGPLIYGGIATRLSGVKRILYVEHDAWHYETGRDRMLARGCFRLLRPKVIAVSDQVKTAIQKIMPDLHVTVIPPGIATDRFLPSDQTAARRRLGLPLGVPIVGSAGRLVLVKAHHILLRAMSQLPEMVECAIAGDGAELANLQALAKDLGIAERVHFLGHRDDLWQVYPAFDVFCLPSDAEGMPRTILEAQACGIPVVATAVGGIAEALHPETSALVPPSDAPALAKALALRLSNLERLPSPHDFVCEKMSLSATAQQYRALYQQ